MFFPMDFDYSTLVTEEDKRLRKLAEKYSEATIDLLMEKYMFPDNESGWRKYVENISDLIAKNLPESEFAQKLLDINYASGSALM